MSLIQFGLLFTFLVSACTRAPQRGGPLNPSLSQAGNPGADNESGGAPGGSADQGGVSGPGKSSEPAGKDGIRGLDLQAATTAYPRLTHLQWENAVRDLLVLPAVPGLAKNFPADPSGTDFDNNGLILKVSPAVWSAYQEAAEILADKIGNDPIAYKKLIPVGKTDTLSIVSAFLRKAYRRNPTEVEITDMVALFNEGVKLTGIADTQGAGFSAMIGFVLQSPYFVYRIELGDKQVGKVTKLNAFEIASRLSFAAWNSIPDAQLLDAAASGALLDPKALKEEVVRLFADAKSQDTIKAFHVKAFKIDRFNAVPQDPKKFPDAATFDTATLQKEAELFIQDVILTQGKGLSELLTAPYAFVSDKTAKAYEVPSPGAVPKKVDLDPMQRAGLLSQVGFLSTYSMEQGINAIIKRGHYVHERLLCESFPAPPVPPDDPTKAKDHKTDRERVTAQTSAPACAACHAKDLNPLGFAFENLGPDGKWRTEEINGNPVDAADTYPITPGEFINFNGPVDLMTEIAGRAEAHQCYIRKIAEALYGRNLDVTDADLIGDLGRASREGRSAKELFIDVLTHPQLTVRNN